MQKAGSGPGSTPVVGGGWGRLGPHKFPSCPVAAVRAVPIREAAVRGGRETDQRPRSCSVRWPWRGWNLQNTVLSARELLGADQRGKGAHLLSTYYVQGTLSHFICLFKCFLTISCVQG